MKSRASFALCLIASSLAFGGALGCGGDDTGASGGDAGGADATKDSGGGVDSSAADTGGGGADTGTGSDTGAGEAGGDDTGTGEAGGDDGGTGDGGSTDGGIEGGLGDAAVPDCTTYCALMMANCTGANAQYTALTECMNACANLPPGMPQDKMGDTIGCRIYHAGLAATAPNPHCWHAGPYGFGACGTNCDAFCTLATTWCSAAGGFDGGAAPYGNLGQCMSACNGFTVLDGGADPGAYSAAGPTSGNTLDCREWHLGAALVDHSATGQQLHCNHVGATSSTCM